MSGSNRPAEKDGPIAAVNPDGTYRFDMAGFTIARPAEETECDHCGRPLYIGDRAVIHTTANVYCSVGCCCRAHPVTPRRREPHQKGGQSS